MAVTLAVSAGDNAVANTDATVTSALAGSARAFLPVAGDGTGSTSAEGATVEFISSAAAGAIEVLTNSGFHIATCGGLGTLTVVVRNGTWVVAGVADANIIAAKNHVANGAGAVAVSASAPAAVITPGTIAGWLTHTLSDGTLAYTPYWK